jgi:hypothetical protein
MLAWLKGDLPKPDSKRKVNEEAEQSPAKRKKIGIMIFSCYCCYLMYLLFKCQQGKIIERLAFVAKYVF